MHQVSIDCGNAVLDARLLGTQHEFFEFSVRSNQRDCGGRFEGDATLGAENGVAQVNAATDAVGAGEGFKRFNQCDRRQGLAIQCYRDACCEFERVLRGWLRVAERVRQKAPMHFPESCSRDVSVS